MSGTFVPPGEAPPDEPPPPPQDGSGRPGPIGVPEHMRGPGGETVPFQAARPGVTYEDTPELYKFGGQEARDRLEFVDPQYWDGDEKNPFKFGVRNEEDRARIQLALEDAGLLETGDYRPGEWDKGTWEAFRDVLGFANVNGLTWDSALTRMIESEARREKDEGPKYPGFLEPTRLEPNPDRLRADVEQFGREKLGRDLSEEETEHLAGFLEESERADFDRMVEVRHDEHEFGKQAELTGQPVTPPEREEFGANVVASEFGQHFDERYAPEIDRQGRVETGRAVSELLQVGGSLVGQMTGGR